ncbi:alpha/beta hydrolase [Nocardioides sp. TRM66260-LWL]|uniref:alpha/beta fold hydrolase n=1 Tax=Nocardioides sp. TRM66260-LWL TaxID=2874478 RepID=UPI001CC8064B|nr:alpha/beta fold hydrolase [Nocardioides sp. TRM66260-LWL]MBZ5734621.1 alpha/beta hydrolase [Nocardioides sp. TRM66260-LWL]
MARATYRLTTHDGLSLHATTYGPEDADVVVALAHCWTADEEDWHYQVRDLLAEHGPRLRIVTWDHRGHGRSYAAPERACTIDDLALDLGLVLDTLAPTGRLVLAGHSIGGMTLTALPQHRPDLIDRIAGLLFVSTSAGGLESITLGLPDVGPLLRGRIPALLATRARLYSRANRRRTPSIERQVVNRFLFGAPLRLRDAGLVVDQIINCPPATMSGFYRDCMRHERSSQLKAYDGIPTRVLVGSRDLLTPPDHGRRLAAGIHGARFIVAPGAGHMLPMERDELVSAQLLELVAAALRDGTGSTTAAAAGSTQTA